MLLPCFRHFWLFRESLKHGEKVRQPFLRLKTVLRLSLIIYLLNATWFELCLAWFLGSSWKICLMAWNRFYFRHIEQININSSKSIKESSQKKLNSSLFPQVNHIVIHCTWLKSLKLSSDRQIFIFYGEPKTLKKTG